MKKLFKEDDKIAYYASDDGKIFSLRKKSGFWKELKLGKAPNGYLHFGCWQNGKMKQVYVHRAVYQTFRGRIPKGLEINHLNCIRDDNRLENLELVTPSQNSNHPPTREHYREAQTKRWSDPVQREKAREAQTKRYSDPAQREKAREAALKRFSDPAQREKAREAARSRMKPVIDVTTGVVYESTREAARQTGLDSGHISASCNGRQHQTGGHAFAYVPTDEERLEHEIQNHIETLANELSGGRL